MYKLLRNLLFLLDAEKAHHFSMRCLKLINHSPFRFVFQSSVCHHPHLQKELLGLRFPNPVGLAAGFDKNAQYLSEIDLLGFGYVEIGTVTPKPQDGNPTPRLFRLPQDGALINRMGFNNAGVQAVVENLKTWRKGKGIMSTMIIGGNIGKNKITANEEAWKDYVICFEALHDYVDYFVVNVSSPNTPGLRELQQRESLLKIFAELNQINATKQKPKPILLKIAPDLTTADLEEIAAAAMDISLDGLIVSNTTISRENLSTDAEILEKIGAGGLSGKPVKARSTELIKYFVEKTNGKIPVIGSGGIFSGEDAKEKMTAGASLIQVWTGFVYQGPFIVKQICRSLLK